ncbi:integrase core domain-containing protein [Hirsutella rhossiliensis]
MSKTSAMAPTKRTILTEPQDWDRWVKELRARVDKLIHKLIFQDGSEAMELPERPTFDDFAQGVRQFVNLTSEQQRAYSAALHEYEGRRKEYLYETKLITAARTAITESISTAKLTSLREDA